MDEDMEEERRPEDSDEEEWKKRRPPSSYGSMKSDSDEDENEDEEEEVVRITLPQATTPNQERLQPMRSDSPETLHTMTSHKLPTHALVIDTRSNRWSCSESERDPANMARDLISTSPEPPEVVEPDDTTQMGESSQSGSLHPDQGLPHIFKCIHDILMRLTVAELLSFKMWVLQRELNLTKQQVMEEDTLDFVDRMLEVLGQDRVLTLTVCTLESVNKPLADELKKQCNKALLRCILKQHLISKHQVIREGVPRAGRRSCLDTIYVEPRISTTCYGGVDPSHEFRPSPPSHLRLPAADARVGLNGVFQLRKGDGGPARTVLTTGIPGIGMSVSVGKFCLDWAEQRANKDLQYVFKLSFRHFWLLRNRNPPVSSEMSILEVMEFYYPELRGMLSVLEEDCQYLVIMDSFDCYQAPLDWENAPLICDNSTRAHPDVLIVNILRGTVLSGARIWILGRQAAVSQIPSQFIDVVTELQGFSDEMKDDFLTRRFDDAELAANIVAHYKRLPTLRILASQPFVCWMMAMVFRRCYGYLDYGEHPPRLTPFYVSIVIVQTNRRLQFYYGKGENDLKWSSDDKDLLTKMGNMALAMLEQGTAVFSEGDVQRCGLGLTEVVVFSGLCTELPAASSDGRRTFCFVHLTVQEFMAALYVFVMFHTEGKNVLDHGSLQPPWIFGTKHPGKSAAELVQCALARTLDSRLGDYDMFLRFLCGLLSPCCHDNQLRGFLFPHSVPNVGGLEKVQRLLEQKIGEAPPDRVENLRECLREMTQRDE